MIRNYYTNQPAIKGGRVRSELVTNKPPTRRARAKRSIGFIQKFLQLRPASKIFLLRRGHFNGFPYEDKAHLEVEGRPKEDRVSGEVTVDCVGEIPGVGWVRLTVAAQDIGLYEVGGYEYWPGMELPCGFGLMWEWYTKGWGG